jgi:hypothetical protein
MEVEGESIASGGRASDADNGFLQDGRSGSECEIRAKWGEVKGFVAKVDCVARMFTHVSWNHLIAGDQVFVGLPSMFMDWK